MLKKYFYGYTLFLIFALVFIMLSACNVKSEPSDAEWWGEYKSDLSNLYIVNYNGTSFSFTFNANSDTEFEGVAAVHDGYFSAEYMDLVFKLAKDSQAITVTQIENKEDKAERSGYTGEYKKE